MWKLNQIPKIMHIYWGGERLSYMRFITFKSFMKLNPDWDIWLWMPQDVVEKVTWASRENDYSVVCNNFMLALLSLPIKQIYVDFKDSEIGSDASEVHRADYIRIYSMYEYGGAWADTDIIFFKPMDDLSVNIDNNRKKDEFVTICSYGHSTGFLMSAPKGRFWGKLKDNIKREFVSTHYQCIGPCMLNKYFPTLQSIPNAVNIPMDAVYRYNFHGVDDLIKKRQSDFTDGSIGCHWYGGNTLWAEFIKKTNGGLMNLPDCIIGNLLRPYTLNNGNNG